MDAEETQAHVVKFIASKVEEDLVVHADAAEEVAEAIMEGLLNREYLIVGSKIHSIVEANWRDSTDEHESYEVYTQPEPAWDAKFGVPNADL